MPEVLAETASAYMVIDGFRCYAPALAVDHADYPSDGFDVTAAVEERSFWCRTRNRVLRSVVERFSERAKPLDMLEIGCGTGTVLGALKAVSNLRLTGSEIYLKGLRHARQRLPGVDFIQLDATAMPFREAYDIVGAFDVLEHIDADELVMRQVRAALRPSGLFVLTVPQYQWMSSRIDEMVCHKRRYSRSELLSKLEAAGFDVVYTTSFVTALFPAMAAMRLLDRLRPMPVDVKADFRSQVALPSPVNFLFDWISRLDEVLLKAGFSLPFGGSLLAVARRSASHS